MMLRGKLLPWKLSYTEQLITIDAFRFSVLFLARRVMLRAYLSVCNVHRLACRAISASAELLVFCFYAGRVHRGKRKASVWCLSVRPSVCPASSALKPAHRGQRRGQHTVRSFSPIHLSVRFFQTGIKVKRMEQETCRNGKRREV